jgi:N-acetylglucosamine-6-sulfatase
VETYDKPFPAGWTGSDFLLDPFTYQYLNATTQRNRDAPVSWEGHYSTDVIANKTYGFLEDAIAAGKPFFLTSAIMAPHANVARPKNGHGPLFTAPIPAERHKHLFPNAKVPRTASFNPAKVGHNPA